MLPLEHEAAVNSVLNAKRSERIKRVIRILRERGTPLNKGAQAILARHFGISRQAINAAVKRDAREFTMLRMNAPTASGEQLAQDVMRERE